MTLIDEYNKIPYYDNVQIRFLHRDCEVGRMELTDCNSYNFEVFKCGIENILHKISIEERKTMISNKMRQMKELQDFFANLSPEDMELMR